MTSKYKLTGSPIKKGIKFCIYGPEGIGKSTLVSKFPGVIFIDTEGSTDHMVVARYPRPQSWDALLDMVDDAGSILWEGHTLVIDTADWAERLCTDALLAKKQWTGIEDAGYGKGYIYQAEMFGGLLDKLTELSERGINVGFCAHAQLRKIEAPEETGAYDHWELKLAKKIGPMVKEWTDLLIFCNYKVLVVKGANPMEKNKVSGGRRVMYTSHHPVWDAKNRFGLPDELDLSYEPLRPIFERNKPASEPDPVPDFTHVEPAQDELPQDVLPDVPFTGPETGPALTGAPKPESAWTEEEKQTVQPARLEDKYPELAQLMAAANISYAEVQRAVGQRGYFPGDMPIEMYPEDFVRGCLVADWSGVRNMITEMRRN